MFRAERLYIIAIISVVENIVLLITTLNPPVWLTIRSFQLSLPGDVSKTVVFKVFLSYLSSEYMSSRLFWMGVPVTAQRARALS